MKTIAEQWLEFSAMVLPDTVSDVQRVEMRKAFFAGFHASMMSHVEVAELPDAQAVAQLEKYEAEGEQFVLRLVAEVGRG
jgi:hypothetical protein